jgi:hypothetical protein
MNKSIVILSDAQQSEESRLESSKIRSGAEAPQDEWKV